MRWSQWSIVDLNHQKEKKKVNAHPSLPVHVCPIIIITETLEDIVLVNPNILLVKILI